jgi:hypothetical protein
MCVTIVDWIHIGLAQSRVQWRDPVNRGMNFRLGKFLNQQIDYQILTTYTSPWS